MRKAKGDGGPKTTAPLARVRKQGQPTSTGPPDQPCRQSAAGVKVCAQAGTGATWRGRMSRSPGGRRAPVDPESDALSVGLPIAGNDSRLAVDKAPRRVVFVEAIPKTPTGKALRRELREREEEAGGADAPGPRREVSLGSAAKRRTRIELASSAWKAEALPLSYRRRQWSLAGASRIRQNVGTPTGSGAVW